MSGALPGLGSRVERQRAEVDLIGRGAVKPASLGVSTQNAASSMVIGAPHDRTAEPVEHHGQIDTKPRAIGM
jgi:hypothetical protein